MAITFVNKGTWGAGTTSFSPGIPAGMAAGDLMILTIHTCNQAVSAISGWTQITSSPVSTGTANTAGGTRLTAYYRFWQSGDAAPTVSVTGGTVSNGIISGYRGVDPTTPFDAATPVATTLTPASTTLTMTGITTNSANACIVWSIARDQDLNNTTAVTAFTNANLTGITEVHDQVVNTSVGGGIWTGYGFKATAGATGNLTITQTSSIAVGLTISLRAAPNVYTLTGLGGSYSLTGQSVSINRNRSLSANGGNYSLTGNSAGIFLNRTLTAIGGVYNITGNSVDITYTASSISAKVSWVQFSIPEAGTQYTLTAQGGSYTLSGSSIDILRNKNLIISGGSYSITGASSSILKSKLISSSGGEYVVTGSPTIINRNRNLLAQGGVYNYTGQQVNFVYAPNGTVYTLTAQSGSYTLSGSVVTLLRSKLIVASGGSYNLTGTSASISRNKYLTASGGAYSLLGSNASISRNRKLTALGGSYTYTGNTIGITYTGSTVIYNLNALGGTYLLTGAFANLLKSKKIIAAGGSYTTSGAPAVVSRNRFMVVNGGSYSLTGTSAVISRNRNLIASGGSYNLTASDAIILKSKLLTALGGSYNLTGANAIVNWYPVSNGGGLVKYINVLTGEILILKQIGT